MITPFDSTDVPLLKQYASDLRAMINGISAVPSGRTVPDDVRWYLSMLRRERDSAIARIRQLEEDA